MRIARTFLSILLMIALLPWGAWAGASGHLGVAAGHGVFDVVATPDAMAATHESRTPEVGTTKRCRKSTLPGLTCVPEPAIEMTWVLHVIGSHSNVRGVWSQSGAAGRNEAPPKEPPRVL